MYLEQARPWIGDDQQHLQTLLGRLLSDQRLFAGRVALALRERHERPDPGPFPPAMRPSTTWPWIIFSSESPRPSADVYAIEQCLHDLADATEIRALAEEILGNARGHLDNLEGLLAVEDEN